MLFILKNVDLWVVLFSVSIAVKDTTTMATLTKEKYFMACISSPLSPQPGACWHAGRYDAGYILNAGNRKEIVSLGIIEWPILRQERIGRFLGRERNMSLCLAWQEMSLRYGESWTCRGEVQSQVAECRLLETG